MQILIITICDLSHQHSHNSLWGLMKSEDTQQTESSCSLALPPWTMSTLSVGSVLTTWCSYSTSPLASFSSPTSRCSSRQLLQPIDLLHSGETMLEPFLCYDNFSGKHQNLWSWQQQLGTVLLYLAFLDLDFWLVFHLFSEMLMILSWFVNFFSYMLIILMLVNNDRSGSYRAMSAE